MRCGGDDAGRRLDRVIRKARPGLPLSAIHRLIRRGAVTVNGERAAPGRRVNAGDDIAIQGAFGAPRQTGLSAPITDGGGEYAAPIRYSAPIPCAENLRNKYSFGYQQYRKPAGRPCAGSKYPFGNQLPLILETPHLLFLNKPAGVDTHGPGSLDEAVRAILRLEPSLSFRPGPLHRLDRNTSGVITFSKTLRGARVFSAALREGRVQKRYLALLEGLLNAEQHWEDTLTRDPRTKKTVQAPDGRQARSTARPLCRAGGLTLAEITIHTGLTHQIRAQAALRGLPLAGDRKYGAASPPPYFLHAARLELPPDDCLADAPPITAPLPPAFAAKAQELFNWPERSGSGQETVCYR